MDAILLEPTDFTPKVILDPLNFKFEISGESRPENAGKFFAPIIQWMEQYKQLMFWQKEKFGKAQPVIFEFKFDYLNSVSAKYIMDVLKQLDNYIKEGFEVTIKWYFDKRDEDMRSTGEEFAELVKVPFDFVSI